MRLSVTMAACDADYNDPDKICISSHNTHVCLQITMLHFFGSKNLHKCTLVELYNNDKHKFE